MIDSGFVMRNPQRAPLSIVLQRATRRADSTTMTAPEPAMPAELPIECEPADALDAVRAGRACLVDIRQPFELELKGRIDEARHVPFFQFKVHLGLSLEEEEQEILDADAPDAADQQRFVANIEHLRQHRDAPLLLVCNSGRRSLIAAHLLRGIGYPLACSVHGGMHALLPLLQKAPAEG